MPRQSITLTEKNDEWLREHVESRGDYANKSELVNDLIRKARRAEIINQMLIDAENSGFSEETPMEMLLNFKKEIS